MVHLQEIHSPLKIGFILLSLLFHINCTGKNSKHINSIEKNMEKKIVSVTLRYFDRAKKSEHTFNIDSTYWELIENVIKTAKYDEEQYDKIKNPNGYSLKIEAAPYFLLIKYDDESTEMIQYWGKKMIVKGSWHFLDDRYFMPFNNMLSAFTNIENRK